MLKSIPKSLLTDVAIIKVCTGTDVWQNPKWAEYTVKHVHLQNTNEVKKTKENTEVVLRSVLFIDMARSKPALDYDALADRSQKAGHPLQCVVKDKSGKSYGEFVVMTVDPVPDVPATRVHHVELGLI